MRKKPPREWSAERRLASSNPIYMALLDTFTSKQQARAGAQELRALAEILDERAEGLPAQERTRDNVVTVADYLSPAEDPLRR